MTGFPAAVAKSATPSWPAFPKASKVETGGFYDFGGQWTPQRVTRVIWLTNFKRGASVHAPQPLHLRDGTILILWEKTGPSGPGLFGTHVAESGQILGQSVCRTLNWQFNRGDRPLVLGDRIFLLATDKTTGETRLCFVYDSPVAAPRPGKHSLSPPPAPPPPGPPRRGR